MSHYKKQGCNLYNYSGTVHMESIDLYSICPRLLTSLWNVRRDLFSGGKCRQDLRGRIWHRGLQKPLVSSECMQEAINTPCPAV